MVTDEGQTVLTNDAAPPPLPPAGGYRGATRIPRPAPSGVPLPPPPQPTPAGRIVGWVALVAAGVFALALLALLLLAPPAALLNGTTVILQLLVVGVIVAGLVMADGRKLAAVALTIALLVNVGTVGAMSALGATTPGLGSVSDEDRFWEAFPGVKDLPADEVLAQPSLEETTAAADAAMADVRETLTAEYGFGWVQSGDASTRPARNGYGGESMLVVASSASWSTLEPITDLGLKAEVMARVEDVLARHGFEYFAAFNTVDSGIAPETAEKFYGSAEPSEQAVWEYYADDWPGVLSSYTTITDLTRDPTGQFRQAREAQVAGTDAPLEGLTLFMLSREVLSETDRDAFIEAMEPYPAGS